MTNPFGLGLVAVMTTASLGLTQANVSGGDSNTAPASFLQATSMAPGEGITFDGGDEFSLNLRNLFQFSWTYASLEAATSTSSFGIDRARTYLQGHAFDPSITYLMSMEWSESTSIKDAWVEWEFWESDADSIGLRTGQSRTMFGRQATNFEGYLELPARQLATRNFAAVRTQGAWVNGNHMDGKLRWNAGVQNGDVAGAAAIPEEAANTDNELSFVGNITFGSTDMGGEWASEGDLEHLDDLEWGIGGGLFLGNATPAADVETTSVNLNAVVKTMGFAFAGEYFTREDDPDVAPTQDSDGWQLTGSWTTAPASTQYSLVAGVSQISLDDANTSLGVTGLALTPTTSVAGDVLEFSLGVNMYYHAHNMKTEIAYVYQDVDPDAGADTQNDIFIIQISLLF